MAYGRCGARAHVGHACRQPALRNGRCRFHGGRNTGNPRPSTVYLQAGRAAAQARRRAQGLPWYGPTPGWRVVVKRMAKAMEQAELMLDAAADAVEAVAPGGELGGMLTEGTRAGLLLQRDTVRQVHAVLLEQGVEHADIKLLRLGNEVAGKLASLSMRLADNELQRRKGDAVEKLLEAIAAEKAITTE